LAGSSAQAQKLADSINQKFPLDTLVQHYSLPAIRAAMQLRANNPAAAIETLRPVLEYDLASPQEFNSLYPAYLRGLAYLQMNDGRRAAIEFQKLLDHPGIVGRDVNGALVLLQMARAQKISGDGVAAREYYERFLSLWKDADPDIPIYRQAKAEEVELTSLH
jgi:tetratricopeptide (TPR) repeat protein